MEYSTIIFEKKNNYALITLNRPDKLNALNKQMFDDLDKAFKTIELDDSPRSGSIVISGSNIFKIEPIRSVVTAYSFSKGTGEYHEKQ